MGIFSKKKSNAAIESPAPTGGGANSAESSVPSRDVDKAAAVIEARARGKLARTQTSQMKANQAMEAAAASPFAALCKCLPCLAPKPP